MQTFKEFKSIFGDKNKEMCQRLAKLLESPDLANKYQLGTPWHVVVTQDEKKNWIVHAIYSTEFTTPQKLQQLHKIAMREAKFVGGVAYKQGGVGYKKGSDDIHAIFKTTGKPVHESAFGDKKHKACMRFEDAIRKNQGQLRDRPQTDVRKTNGKWEVLIRHSLDHIDVKGVQRYHQLAIRNAGVNGSMEYTEVDRENGWITGIFRPK